MKKRKKKSKDESCLMLLSKYVLIVGVFIGALMWGIVCKLRTVNDSLWATLVIIGVSYLLVKLFKNDENVMLNTILCAFLLDAVIFITNFYFPISVQQRKAVVKCVYIDKGVGGRHKTTLTHYVLHFTDNYQETDISGRLEKYNFHDGDTVSITYQHGWIGWDVVSDIKSHCNRSKTTMHREN